MTIYLYRAVTLGSSKKAVSSGALQSQSVQEVKEKLAEKNLQVIYLQSYGLNRLCKKVRLEHILEFVVHLQHTEKTNIPLNESLQMFASALSPLRYVSQIIMQQIEEGQTLSQALKVFPHIFDEIIVLHTHLGEKTGLLGESLSQVEAYLRWKQSLNDQLRKAIRYPVFVIGALCCVMFFLMSVVVPQIAQFLTSLNSKLPFLTRLVIDVSEVFQSHGAEVGAGALSFIITVGGLIKYNVRCRRWCAKGASLLPWVASLQNDITFARYFYCLGHMCENHINLLTAMNVANQTNSQGHMAQTFHNLIQQVTQGKSLGEALYSSGHFPGLVVRVITSGEITGQLPASLRYLKMYYDRQISTKLEILIGCLEPALMVIVGLFLSLIVYATFWPLYETLSMVDI